MNEKPFEKMRLDQQIAKMTGELKQAEEKKKKMDDDLHKAEQTLAGLQKEKASLTQTRQQKLQELSRPAQQPAASKGMPGEKQNPQDARRRLEQEMHAKDNDLSAKTRQAEAALLRLRQEAHAAQIEYEKRAQSQKEARHELERSLAETRRNLGERAEGLN